MIVYDQKERVANWVGKYLGGEFHEPYEAMGIDRGGDLIGGVVFNCFEGSSIEMNFAGPGAFQKNALFAIFDYPFNQLEVSRVSVKCRADNKPVLSSAPKLGFKQEGVLRRYYGDCDAILFGMLKKECRYLI